VLTLALGLAARTPSPNPPGYLCDLRWPNDVMIAEPQGRRSWCNYPAPRPSPESHQRESRIISARTGRRGHFVSRERTGARGWQAKAPAPTSPGIPRGPKWGRRFRLQPCQPVRAKPHSRAAARRDEYLAYDTSGHPAPLHAGSSYAAGAAWKCTNPARDSAASPPASIRTGSMVVPPGRWNRYSDYCGRRTCCSLLTQATATSQSRF